MKRILALVFSVAVNAALLGALQSAGDSGLPKGEVYITEVAASAAPDLQLAAR